MLEALISAAIVLLLALIGFVFHYGFHRGQFAGLVDKVGELGKKVDNTNTLMSNHLVHHEKRLEPKVDRLLDRWCKSKDKE